MYFINSMKKLLKSEQIVRWKRKYVDKFKLESANNNQEYRWDMCITGVLPKTNTWEGMFPGMSISLRTRCEGLVTPIVHQDWAAFVFL